MYVLEYLKYSRQQNISVEYRLLCSGTLYQKGLLGDWTKSDGARLLLWNAPEKQMPCDLIVAARPIYDYPQELVLRFGGHVETNILRIDGPGGREDALKSELRGDSEIATDLAALFTLLTRRLITVAGKVREVHSDKSIPPSFRDFPIPIALSAKRRYWSYRPITIKTSIEGTEYEENQPPPCPFDTGRALRILESLPGLPMAEVLIRVARHYALALELIETRFEIAYQHLITAVETAAGYAFDSWKPGEDEVVLRYGGLVAAGKKMGLSEDQRRELAALVARDNPWSLRKFVKFLSEYASESVFETEDNVFIVPQDLMPTRANLEPKLREIYQMRSGASHGGKSFPPSACIGPSTMIPAEAGFQFMKGREMFPPIGWFERVVHSAINNYLDKCVREYGKPPALDAVESEENSKA